MAYLYGDSTPFPLNENFIETLRGTTDTCLELLQADESMELVRMQSEQEKTTADRDIGGVERLAAVLRDSMEPHRGEGDSPFVTEIFTRLMGNAKNVFDAAAREVVSRRDSVLLQMESRVAAERTRLPQALERFLLRHQLPETQWGLNWVIRAGSDGQGQAQAWAVARTPAGLEATFELDLMGSPLWSRAFRVGEVKPDLVIQLPRKGRWLDKGASLKEERLDRWVVTEVSLTPERCAVGMRKSLSPGSRGLEFSIGTGDSPGTTVRSLDDPSGPEEIVLLEGLDGAAIESVWETLAVRLRPLAANRVRLVQALFSGTPVADAEPAAVARMLIRAIAPYVREMCRRSGANAGELVLKREVEDGRREELFISIHELTDKFSSISPKRQAFFEDFGLVYSLDTDGGMTVKRVMPTGEMMVHGEMIVKDEAQKSGEIDSRQVRVTGPVPANDPEM